jgi:hypothetical protein
MMINKDYHINHPSNMLRNSRRFPNIYILCGIYKTISFEIFINVTVVKSILKTKSVNNFRNRILYQEDGMYKDKPYSDGYS